jgi:lysophospholipid acyltransferase
MDRAKSSFFFPSMLIGPSLDYVTYDSLVLKTIYNITPPGQDDSQAKLKRRIPHGRKRVAYLHLVIGLGFLGIYAVYGGRAAYQRVLTPAWYTWSLLSKIGFIQLAGIVARIKYYSVWSLAEVSHHDLLARMS